VRVSIADNLAVIRERLERAARRAGRDPATITLMAVGKTQPVERIVEAYQAGQRVFGENRVQEFAMKAPRLAELTDARFHLIGHLQSNKASKAASLFHAVDSIDSLRLAERLNAAAEQANKRLPVLIEVNIGGEAAKEGVAPDAEELETLLRNAPTLAALEIRGLMAVPPFTEDPEGARPYFRRLRELSAAIGARKLPAVAMEELSMGMSHDFEIAVDEGSTCVRIGTAIFGARANARSQ
jgi:pyridoxal phosphate enzyme (YggS family)